jgi:hypothetical protein
VSHDTEDAGEEGFVQRWLTVPGRLLLICAIVGTIGGGVWWFEWTCTGPTPGSYPVIFWTSPVLLAGGAFFGLGALALERIGVKVFKRPQDRASERR